MKKYLFQSNFFRITAVLFTFFLFANLPIGADSSRKSGVLGVGINLAGPTAILSAAVDYALLPEFTLETGGGFLGYYGGGRYFLVGDSWSPYLGLMINRIPQLDAIAANEPTKTGLYIPVGLEYQGNGGFYFAPEAAVMLLPDSDNWMWAGVRLGYRFF